MIIANDDTKRWGVLAEGQSSACLPGNGGLSQVVEKQLFAHGLESAFGITHGGRRIVVKRAEVAMALDEGFTQGEGLRRRGGSESDRATSAQRA